MAQQPDDEFQRLAKTYADKYDAEIRELASERDTLTDAARRALDEEIARRGLDLTAVETFSADPEFVVEPEPAEVDRTSKEYKHFAEVYSRKRDYEIETLARQRDSLLPVARAALDDELARRGVLSESPVVETRNTTTAEHADPSPNPPDFGPANADAPASEERPDPENMVIAETFRDLPVALIAKGFLDSAEVKNLLIDETTIRMDWFLSNAIGGIKLAVMREDLEAAKEALARGWETPLELPDGETVPLPRCPQCDSPDVSFKALNKRASLPPLLPHIPVRTDYPAWRCNNCGVLWEDTEGGAPLE
jgi:hypothetical protein